MDFKNNAKKTCPKCGNQTKKATKNIGGVDIPSRICSGCGWFD